MIQRMQRNFSWVALSLATMVCMFGSQAAARTVVWESSESLIDTTNYTGLADYYWFANFQTGALTPVTGAGMDSNEARVLPSWIHLETRPACNGMADDCVTPDANSSTGYSFTEPNSSSTGGQPSFNDLTLPDGTFGRSGQSVDSIAGTSSYAALRILPGAPESFRMWVVVDNGVDPNFNTQSRMRVNLRNTTGPPLFTAEGSADSEAEADPGGPGSRLIGQPNSIPQANNGIADAWSYLFEGVEIHDRITIRPTSVGADFASFAGIMIQVVPEPSSAMLLLLGGTGALATMRRRRG